MIDLSGRLASGDTLYGTFLGLGSALAAESGYDTILAGHGLPTGPEVYEDVLRYLADTRELPDDDGEAYEKAIVHRYPSYVGPFIIDIANRSLFPADR